MRPIVSVIMPTYNRAHLLPKAIDSVFSQTYPEIELIIVNDGSTDNTQEALEPYQDKIIYIQRWG
ncbi:MAG: glycosyltransferase family 2 protein [Planctomycetota bacterium]|jgi:glycosyltransferase involved in cell wall biosynthesis